MIRTKLKIAWLPLNVEGRLIWLKPYIAVQREVDYTDDLTGTHYFTTWRTIERKSADDLRIIL